MPCLPELEGRDFSVSSSTAIGVDDGAALDVGEGTPSNPFPRVSWQELI